MGKTINTNAPPSSPNGFKAIGKDALGNLGHINSNPVAVPIITGVPATDTHPKRISVGNILKIAAGTFHSLVRLENGTTLPAVVSLGGLPDVVNDQNNTHVYLVGAAGGSDLADAYGTDLRIDTTKVTATRGRVVRDPATGDVMRHNGTAWSAL